MSADETQISRRRMMCDATRYLALGGIGSLSAWLLYRQTGQAAAACPSSNAACSECSQAAIFSDSSRQVLVEVDKIVYSRTSNPALRMCRPNASPRKLDQVENTCSVLEETVLP